MNTNASIKKESKVDRARRRLEIAIENLDSIILNYSPNSNDAKSEVPHLTTEVKRLGEELNILTKKNRLVSDRIGQAISRLKVVIGE